jgi:alpha-tubulin suppressor-like RCC1 family protein
VAAGPAAYAWGADSSGQLGDGSTSQQSLPVPVSGTPKLVQVSASEDFTVALDSQGNAWAWGSNASGQLGNGTYNDSAVPVRVTMPLPPGVTFTAIAANAGGCCRGHVIALDSTGKLWGWGADDYNDNGTGSATNVPAPNTAAPSSVSFKAVGAGADAGYAVAADGTPYGWGDNSDGALNFPAGVQLNSISGGCDVGWGLDASGQAYSWGADYYGQLGTGGTGPGKVIMPAGVAFRSVSPGRCTDFTVAVGNDGQVYAWGANGSGQLGDGTTTSHNSPQPVKAQAPPGVSFLAASAGGQHAVALDSTGNAWSWGDNSQGQLGIGAGPGQPIPQPICTPVSLSPVCTSHVTFDGIAAGDFHSIATTPNGGGGADQPLTGSLFVRQVGTAGSPIAVFWDFGDADAGAVASDFAATIDWGDGSTSSGGVTQSCVGQRNCTFLVGGIHDYLEAGTFHAMAHVKDVLGRNDTGGSSVDIPGTIVIRQLRADCYDMVAPAQGTEPVLDSEPAGDYCRRAVAAQGYDAHWDRKAGAGDAWSQAPYDAVVYHAGHSLVCAGHPVGDPLQIAAGLAFFKGGGSNLSVFGGSVDDPCMGGGTVFYDAPARLQHAKFVILQDCLTAHDSRYGESIGHQIYDAGAGTVVGFDKEIDFSGRYGAAAGSNRPYGDAWAAGFWAAFGSGRTISESVDAAVAYEQRLSGPGYGYDRKDIRILAHPGAANRLAADQSIPRSVDYRDFTADIAARAATSGRRLTSVLTSYLGRRLNRHIHWTAQAGISGKDYAASIPSVGMFVIEGPQLAVVQAVFDPARQPGPHSISKRQAMKRAVTFAARHATSLAGLQLRLADVTTVETSREFEFLWQARSKGVWLPSTVGITIRGDGSIASYIRDVRRVRVPLTPKVSRRRAVQVARRIAGASAGTTARVTELTVRDFRPGVQKLVWIVSLTPTSGQILSGTIVWVDAETGRPT